MPEGQLRVVNVHQAKTHLSRLIDEAHASETIVPPAPVLVSEASMWKLSLTALHLPVPNPLVKFQGT